MFDAAIVSEQKSPVMKAPPTWGPLAYGLVKEGLTMELIGL